MLFTSNTLNRTNRFLLTTGFFAIFAAVHIAREFPATSYEPSIYSSTPTIFWALLLFSLFLSLSGSFNSEGCIRLLYLLLGILSFISVVWLPLIRGYFFIGRHDPLQHLGLVREILAGDIAVFSYHQLPDPAFHMFAIFLSKVLNLNLPSSLNNSVFIFNLLFVASIILLVSCFSESDTSGPIAMFSGFFLLPINWMSVYNIPHPSSQAILALPFLLFNFSQFILGKDERYFIIFTVFSSIFVLLHPLPAAMALLIFSVVSFGYIILQFYSGENIVYKNHIPLLIYSILYLLWISGRRIFGVYLAKSIEMLLNPGFGQELSQGSASLGMKGLSLFSVFLRLFSIGAVYSVLSVLTVWWLISDRRFLKEDDYQHRRDQLLLVLTVGFGFVVLIFLIYFVIERKSAGIYFRLHGLIMVFVTVLGAIAFNKILGIRDSKVKKNLIVITLAIFLVISVPVIHSSDYIGKPSRHVTEAQFQGYETTFNYNNEEIKFVEVNSVVFRYRAAIYGASENLHGGQIRPSHEIIDNNNRRSNDATYRAQVPVHFANRSLHEEYNQTRYLPVTISDRRIEVQLYNENRFSEEDFAYLESQPETNKVITNGHYNLYIIQ